jgi:hypothetical protein
VKKTQSSKMGHHFNKNPPKWVLGTNRGPPTRSQVNERWSAYASELAWGENLESEKLTMDSATLSESPPPPRIKMYGLKGRPADHLARDDLVEKCAGVAV